MKRKLLEVVEFIELSAIKIHCNYYWAVSRITMAEKMILSPVTKFCQVI